MQMSKKYLVNYLRSQYEDIAVKFDSLKIVEARYIEQKEIMHQGNDLIEALPRMKNDIESIEDFEYFPFYDEKECLYSDKERALAIMRLDHFRIAREYTALLDDCIAIALRRCYVSRKKFNLESMECLLETGKFYRDCEYRKIEGSKVQGFTLIGVSGGGKSTSISSALAYYPQVIVHEEADNRAIQIVYLKVECPADGSIKAFYDSCFSEFEEVLGAEIPGVKRSKTTDSKALLFKKLALRYNLGLLVIEEIQNLSIKREDTMNQFLTLTNDTQIPIVFVGTYKACNRVFDIDFRLGRRGGANIEVKRFIQGDYWDYLMSNMWKYQWVKVFVPLTPELSELFYSETGGIIDRVINLFQMVQLDAIQSGVEKITKSGIKNISKKYFSTTRKMIHTIDNFEDRMRYEDIYSPSDINKSKEELLNKLKYQSTVKNIINKDRNSKKEDFLLLRKKIVINIKSLLGNQIAIQDIEDAINELSRKDTFFNKSEAELNMDIIQHLLSNSRDTSNKESKKKRKNKIIDDTAMELPIIEGEEKFDFI